MSWYYVGIRFVLFRGVVVVIVFVSVSFFLILGLGFSGVL